MAKPSPLTYLPLWERALTAEIGIRFRVTGVAREYFRNTLYEARKLSQDPQLEEVMIFLPAGEASDEVWLCKREVRLDE